MNTCTFTQHKDTTKPDKQMLRVLHVLPSLHRGGMETAFLRLLHVFKEEGNRNTKPEIQHMVCILRDGDPDLLQQSQALYPTFTPSSGRGCWRSLRKLINQVKPHVVHARTTGAWIDATLAGRKFNTLRLLLSFHGLTNLKPPSLRRKISNRWCLQHAHAVMTVCRSAADMLTQKYNVPAHKLFVLPNGVDTEIFHPPHNKEESTNTRNNLNVPTDAFPVICVANLLPIKGIDALLQAWSQVASAHPAARLLLVGEGPLRQSFEQLTNELGIASTIQFLGQRKDVPALLRAAELFVLPSRYEGHSNAVLEAAASALPIIATDVGGTREIIRNEHNGWLVQPDDPNALATQILTAINNAPIRKQLGKNARNDTLARFSPDHWAEQYNAMYQQLGLTTEAAQLSTEEAALCVG